MDVFDKLALWGRKYDQQINPRTGTSRFDLSDLLAMFDMNTILELTHSTKGKPAETFRPDPVRKLKISLLDEGISGLGGSAAEWYEVYKTGPSGDLAKVRIVAHSSNGPSDNEIRMLVAERNPELYFREDTIFSALVTGEGSERR